ncbi:MAG TPA: protein kinase, partial [Gemmataceae bacterium]|nr:protein kinase [Gemmataceae bacterium]
MSEQAEPVSIHEWVDDIADQFEKAWQGMKPPMVNEFLGDADGERRAALLSELIQIDLAYRARFGDCRQVDDYYQDFPELRNLPTPDFVSPTPLPKTFHPPVSKGGNPANKSWPNIPGYEILGELGHGGMGVVYKARQDRLKRVVALKMISPGKQAGEWEQSRFRTEMEAVARLQHPNIVQIYEVGEQDGRQYCALEYVEGLSLSQWLAGTPKTGQEAANLLESLARAVYYAHQQGIIHRDLKPGNVLLGVGVQRSTVNGPQKTERSLLSSIPKIADFGLAKRLDATAGAEQTRTGEILGTPSYMAPEQAEGKSSMIGPGADIYSLGAILYELLSGRPPFKGESTLDTLLQVRSQEPVAPSRLQPKVPRDLETICVKAMAKSPDRRYGTADELANDLRRFLDGKPILARPVSQVEKLWRWGRRNPMVAALSATILMVLLAGTVVSMFFAFRAEQGAKDARRNLYGSHMNLAQHYWQQGQIHQAMALLSQHEPLPGAPDERCWEWHYLSRLCRADLRTLEGPKGSVNALAFSPDGRRLASGAGAVWLWDVATGKVLHKFAPEVSDAVTSLAFSPNGRLLAWVGSGKVSVWSLADDQMLSTFPGRSSIGFSSDSRFLASNGTKEGTIEVWNPVTGKLLFHLEGHGDLVSSLAYSPDGQWLASASNDQTIKLWDLAARKVVRTVRGHRGRVSAVAFSPDGHRLGSAGHDQTVRIWDVGSGRVLHILKGHGSEVNSIAFSPSGQQFASASGDHTIKLWEVAGGEELFTFRGHKSGVSSVVFSPDGRQLGSASDDGIIKLWDAASDQEAHILTGHHGASFSPDGRYLAAPGPGRTVKVWNATGLQVVQILKGHSQEVWAVAFSPDSRLLAAASGVRKQKKWVSGE